MIRGSNQLSPKTKVVALIVLYNFYFGQISGFNMKFGVLDGQSQLKTTRSRSTVTPLFCSVHRRPSTLALPRVGRRGEPRSPRVSYPLASSGGFWSSSLSPSSRPRQAEPERAVIVAVAAPTTRPPPCRSARFLASRPLQPCPEPSPPLLELSHAVFPAESSVSDRRPPSPSTPSFAPPVELPLPALLSSN